MEQNYWQKSEEHLPRFWLELETENLLIPWETVQAVRASPDFLNLSFTCEFGHIQFSSASSLRELFVDSRQETIHVKKTGTCNRILIQHRIDGNLPSSSISSL